MPTDLTRDLMDLIERGRDRQLRLAVTGLSRAGKTAFLTSLVDQLRHAGLEARLDLLTASREGRLLGAQRVSQQDLAVPRFPFDRARASLESTPPEWPQPTRGISELRLKIRYRPGRQQWLRPDTAELTLDLFDYPGEWLLDLPLLDHDFLSWSLAQWDAAGPARRAMLADWESAVSELRLDDEADEARLAEISERYAEGLRAAREAGFSDLQPGRFLLPGELSGRPGAAVLPATGA